jgi:chromosomal replication initiator protein
MKTEAEQLWKSAQALLRSLLPADIYELWYAPVRAAGMDSTTLTLAVADHHCEEWLRNQHATLLNEVVAKLAGRPLALRFHVTAYATTTSPKSSGGSSGLRPMFNPRNTFDTFVVGNNQFAHALALAVAQAPGKAYNPILLYGGIGLGKTHLLQAIGHHVVTQRPDMRVTCVTIEQLTNEFIAALQDNALAEFRDKYQQSDLLLVDDVQILTGRGRVQVEFLQLVEALHEAGKQIVLTGDRPADEIPGLEPGLVARFEWGLVTDLQPPDYETRVAIVRQRTTAMNVALPDEVTTFLAKRIRADVRRLEGALIRVVSYAALTGKSLSVPIVETILRDVLMDEVALTNFRWKISGPVDPSSSFGLN